MLGKIKSLFDSSTRRIKSTEEEVEAIMNLSKELENKSFDEMKDRINEMRKELSELVDKVPSEAKRSLVKVNRRENFPDFESAIQEKLWEFMPEVYAMINETYRRVAGKPYYKVQLQAGVLLGRGQLLVEQYTGEGKTQTFQLPLALYSLVGRGAHLVTVNNYLTKVGAEFAGHMLSKIGISVGVIAPEGAFKFIPDEDIAKYKSEELAKQREGAPIEIDRMDGTNLIETTKRDAYGCDITYSTNNELGFDYLRDNMVWELSRKVQRELYFCIIDEADSILIDEARTPLIISATPSDADTEKYTKFANAVNNLVEGEEADYVVDYKARSVSLTEEGMSKVEQNLGLANAWEDFGAAYHIENALKAKALFTKDDQYMVRGGEVFIVDEFTGRVLEGRRYSEGLHQAIEAKEGVDIKQESKTFATITFQNFFRLYKVLCGGSGTIMTESEEFYKIYGLDSVVVPTNRPRIRIDYPDRIYKNQEAKFNAVVEEIKEMHEMGRPVLVGTTSVEKSELVSSLLDKSGIPHEVLNAKFHEQESKIVAKAGVKGAVTVATNMAGRGTDIVVGGGVRGDDTWKEVIEVGGLHVIGTERHDSRRIDNQLRGRTGRQGEAGSTRFYASLDDQIMRVLGGEIIARLFNMVKVPDDMPIEMAMISNQIETAQKRVEGVNFDSRKRLVEYDDVMNQHREIFYSRREDLLVTAENALGRFIKGLTYIDVNLPEHKEQEAAFEEQISSNQEKMEETIRQIVINQAEHVIYEKLPVGTKLTEENVTEFLNIYKNIIPEPLLRKTLDISLSDTAGEIIKKSESAGSVQDMLLDATEDLFEDKLKEFDNDFYSITKSISLESLDKKWVDHLEIMKDVRDSIALQGYAQRTPIVEYKNKAFQVFQSFINGVDNDIASKFFKLTKISKAQMDIARNLQTNVEDVEDVLTGDREMMPGDSEKAKDVMQDIEKSVRKRDASLRTNSKEQSSRTVKSSAKKYGRNEKVTVEYSDGTVKKDVKYKKVENDVNAGRAKLI